MDYSISILELLQEKQILLEQIKELKQKNLSLKYEIGKLKSKLNAYNRNKQVFTNEQYEQLNDKVIALTKELKTLKGE